MQASVALYEVGPRDGLQNEKLVLSPSTRAELCRQLQRTGLRHIEAVSFVSSSAVRQMAGAEDVLRELPIGAWSALILNEKGFDRAIAAGVREVNFAIPVTDSFCLRNQGMTVSDAIDTAGRLVGSAHAASVSITVTLGASFGCPFEGRVSASHVLKLTERVLRLSPDAIVFADTIGVGVPTQVRDLFAGARSLGTRAGGHFHNTRNTGYANAVEAVNQGCDRLDASIGGSGGCPFAPNATGNIATEDLVYILEGMGVATGVTLDALIKTSRWLGKQLSSPLPAMLPRAGKFPG